MSTVTNDTILQRKLQRTRDQVVALERFIEERTRALYEAQEQLRRTTNFLENVLGHIKSGVVVLDLSGRIVRVNAAAAALSGRPAPQLLGRSLGELLPDLAGADLAAIEAVDRELAWLGGKGERIPVLFAASAMRDNDGDVIGTVCIAHEIREKQELELKLRHAQKLESVGQLAAGIAHEINTPVQFAGDSVGFVAESSSALLRVLEAYRELRGDVEDEGEHGERVAAIADLEAEVDLEFLLAEQPAALTRARDGLMRIATIVGAMKAFSHPGQVEKAPTDLNECLRTTVEVCRNEYKYVADVELDLGSLPLVHCNSGDLNQVFLNLIVNAAHAIESAIAGSDRRGFIRIGTAVDGDHVTIAIGDTGTGIPEAIRGRVFDPFFTTKAVGRGTGQGLAIAHSLVVDKHGGDLSFTTEDGVGTTFVVRLPVAAKGVA